MRFPGLARPVGWHEDRVIDALAEEFESRYAELNPNNEELFSEDILEDFTAQYTGYVARGFSRPQSVRLALDNVVTIYGLKPIDGDAGEGDTDEGKGAGKKKVAKKKAATKKAIQRKKKAPADPSGVGNAGDSDGEQDLDAEEMTDEELDALPASALARMRGDDVGVD